VRPKAVRDLRGEEDDLPAAPGAAGGAGTKGVIAAETTTHRLKVHPGPFRAIKRGDKRFEYRKDDRGFRIDHRLFLMEWDPAEGDYTGDELMVLVTHMTRGPDFDVPRGYVIMSIAPITMPVHVKGDLAEERRRRDGLGTEAL